MQHIPLPRFLSKESDIFQVGYSCGWSKRVEWQWLELWMLSQMFHGNGTPVNVRLIAKGPCGVVVGGCGGSLGFLFLWTLASSAPFGCAVRRDIVDNNNATRNGCFVVAGINYQKWRNHVLSAAACSLLHDRSFVAPSLLLGSAPVLAAGLRRQ